MMNLYIKSLYTHSYKGNIHVDDLLYLYEKIRIIAFHIFPAFKKIEPSFDIRSEHGDSMDLTAQKLENLFSPDEILSSCSFTLRLPASGNDQQDISSISFASDNRRFIHITAEGTNKEQVDAIADAIIFSINPYISDMNKERQPPVKHDERIYTIKTEPAKHDKPDAGKSISVVPDIKSNLSDSESEHHEKASRKNSKYIFAAIIVIVLFIAIVIIIAALK